MIAKLPSAILHNSHMIALENASVSQKITGAVGLPHYPKATHIRSTELPLQWPWPRQNIEH